jgi:hypothetical protein
MKFTEIKPLFEFNNGEGATLCRSCRKIICTGEPVNELNCTQCKEKHKENRHKFTWSSIYDEYGEKVEEPVERKVSDLTNQHLIRIVFHFEELGYDVPRMIINEISYRRNKS